MGRDPPDKRTVRALQLSLHRSSKDPTRHDVAFTPRGASKYGQLVSVKGKRLRDLLTSTAVSRLMSGRINAWTLSTALFLPDPIFRSPSPSR